MSGQLTGQARISVDVAALTSSCCSISGWKEGRLVAQSGRLESRQSCAFWVEECLAYEERSGVRSAALLCGSPSNGNCGTGIGLRLGDRRLTLHSTHSLTLQMAPSMQAKACHDLTKRPCDSSHTSPYQQPISRSGHACSSSFNPLLTGLARWKVLQTSQRLARLRSLSGTGCRR